jgi:putative SOS response-associated peptidase YedK
MCNFYRLDASSADIAVVFDADAGPDPWSGGYVAPGRFGPVIARAGRSGKKLLRPMHWGYPPPGQIDTVAAQAGRWVANVRNLASPFWIGNLRHTELRCLVPATRFQLWSGSKGTKSQHWFGVPSQPIFAFAGIWRDLTDMPVFAFLTTDPNSLIAPAHPATMPLILHPEDWDVWLNADWKDAQKLVEPFPAQLMTSLV